MLEFGRITPILNMGSVREVRTGELSKVVGHHRHMKRAIGFMISPFFFAGDVFSQIMITGGNFFYLRKNRNIFNNVDAPTFGLFVLKVFELT